MRAALHNTCNRQAGRLQDSTVSASSAPVPPASSHILAVVLGTHPKRSVNKDTDCLGAHTVPCRLEGFEDPTQIPLPDGTLLEPVGLQLPGGRGSTTGSIKRYCTSTAKGAGLDMRTADWVGPARWGWSKVSGRGPREAREVQIFAAVVAV